MQDAANKILSSYLYICKCMLLCEGLCICVYASMFGDACFNVYL